MESLGGRMKVSPQVERDGGDEAAWTAGGAFMSRCLRNLRRKFELLSVEFLVWS